MLDDAVPLLMMQNGLLPLQSRRPLLVVQMLTVSIVIASVSPEVTHFYSRPSRGLCTLRVKMQAHQSVIAMYTECSTECAVLLGCLHTLRVQMQICQLAMTVSPEDNQTRIRVSRVTLFYFRLQVRAYQRAIAISSDYAQGYLQLAMTLQHSDTLDWDRSSKHTSGKGSLFFRDKTDVLLMQFSHRVLDFCLISTFVTLM